MIQYLLSAAPLLGLAAAANYSFPAVKNISQADIYQGNGPLPCEALIAAGLRDRVLLPADTGYEPQVLSWWAWNSRQHPYCLVLPQNTQEVSLALTTLVHAGKGAGDWHIAVRSGGHSTINSNNIVNGVTIDLSHMNSSSYDESTNTARVQPGGRWQNVYADLQERNITVAGGRDGDVGVGGFTLGGGNSFYSGRHSFACDTVNNFEVVLGNGTVVNANNKTNSDLYKALKGGTSNFGIVTRFDFNAIPSLPLFHETRVMSANYTNIVLDAIVDYIRKLPAYVNKGGVDNMAAAAKASQFAGESWNAGATVTFRNNPTILRYVNKLHDEYVKALQKSIGPDNFSTAIFLQPVPSYYAKISKAHGGSMMPLEKLGGNAVMWTGGVAVKTTTGALAFAKAGMHQMAAKLTEFAKTVDGHVDMIYLNYADATQDPLGSYGADRVEFMRKVAAKYDPAGVFQSRVPGGFKVNRV
ncbi:hypothetical protein ASPWEDRAFT_60249 [Aspergillus wentii DTO 134E9]|uniref:FAD-binding PCMH-type domain-containing protein n=1 Tax=Aspergillus wentii DTO 134E9 TaxID=1073089 RepID=A0A1L9RMX2_ASPWE|nr:uncharacterized protein ASPWEDRAFT_60249 [Aspergillus wentii DTO 134E9]OJJ36233.1 hypothetical protein ASPWEDRAFT_60249 [Aspergillus wentii DTO 134E9]